MSCDGYGLLISKWVDGEAKPDEVRRAESHIAQCAPCRKLADEFRRNAGLVEAALGPEPFGHRVAGSVFGSIARREALWRWGARLGAAAAIILAMLLLRADRNADQERFHSQITDALRVLQQAQDLLAQQRARDAAPQPEIVWMPPFPENWGAGGKPVEDQELPRAVAKGSGTDPRPALPEKHPGTFAQDRVDAYADYETGNVAVSWNMDRVVYATLARLGPPTSYVVFRREDGTEEWGDPLNDGLLVEPKFEDVTARGLTTYEYRVVAITGREMHVSDDIARLKTPPDLRLEFKGLGTLDDQTSFVFRVHVRVNGKWLEETFRVNPGESIGGPRNGVDFATGVIFRQAARYQQPGTLNYRQCATLETPSGRILLWQGTSALGSRESLEADELLK